VQFVDLGSKNSPCNTIQSLADAGKRHQTFFAGGSWHRLILIHALFLDASPFSVPGRGFVN
jgi:hypothetical protein